MASLRGGARVNGQFRVHPSPKSALVYPLSFFRFALYVLLGHDYSLLNHDMRTHVLKRKPPEPKADVGLVVGLFPRASNEYIGRSYTFPCSLVIIEEL